MVDIAGVGRLDYNYKARPGMGRLIKARYKRF
jgi:hypothetical protein